MRDLRSAMAWAAAAAFCLAAPAAAADSDADFVAMAASDGMLEAELGMHASKNAASASVREYGSRMLTDHTKANQELKVAAARAGVAVPARMSEEHQGMLKQLQAKRGEEFDRAYMQAMVEDHEKAVESFRAQAEQNESEIDRWAAKTLPTLEAHLAQARSIHQQLEESPAAMED